MTAQRDQDTPQVMTPRRQIRRLQRLYVEEWVTTLSTLRPELDANESRVLVHGAFGLMNATPFMSGEVDQARRAALLQAATLSALTEVSTGTSTGASTG